MSKWQFSDSFPVPASDIAVNGGVFNDACLSWATGDIKFITGGTFAINPSNFVVEGYEAVQDGNSEYYIVSATN